jgi:multimeric flavodoxin WrbA
MLNFNEYVENKNKKNIVLIVGSARSSECCPDEESKTHKMAKRLQKEFDKQVKFETIDLSVKCDGINVLPCKGCISTSAFHCSWPCSCYGKKSDPKDLMYEQDVYNKLEKCDAFFVLTPINWSAPSSVVKSFFDRLVCASLTLTTEQAEEILGKENLKNSKITRKIEKSCKYDTMLKNHLEGKHAGFFAHGNNGGADYKEFVKNKTRCTPPKLPQSIIEYEKTHGKEEIERTLEPVVRQCVYSGIIVPDDCVKTFIYGYGLSYSEGNDLFKKEDDLYEEFLKTFNNLLTRLK